jgi:trk system potassium uptake protein TrkH
VRFKVVTYVLGWILIFFSAAMLPSAAIGMWYGSGGVAAILYSVLFTIIFGLCLLLTKPPEDIDLMPRDSFLIVTGGWFLCSIMGALPFFFDSTFVAPDQHITIITELVSFTDSVFECASGLTTTGASVLNDFAQPHAIMFWRSTTHWLGGMGIIVLSLAILPLIGAGGMQLFKAEAPGPVTDRLKPRIKDTAMALSKVYVLITIIETVVLKFCGMGWFDAVCHAFGTMATGGFSTHPLSVQGFESSTINYVITFFMILAGANFALHYRFLKGDLKSYIRNGEFFTYLSIIGASTLLLTGLVFLQQENKDIFYALEHAAFQTASIITTTGFATADFEQWYPVAQMGLFYLMFIGGCAGSTAGGIKVMRIMILAKYAHREMKRLIYPTSVIMLKMDDKTVPEQVAEGIVGFFILTVVMFILSTMLLSAYGLDFITSLTATAACMFNIGPGLGDVGPYDNFSGLPALLKWWLSFCMIVGRLELYSVLILTAPEFWRK